MSSRFPITLPFAILASLAVGCSSSSGGTTPTNDSGPGQDTGVPTSDAGADTGNKQDGSSTDGGAQDAAKDVTTPTDGNTVPTPVPATGSKLVAPGFIQVIGITADDYLIYFDATNGVSASDINGTVTQIVPGSADGGNGPVVAGIGGNLVGILTNYTTKTVSGNTQAVAGTLSIWSHTLGTLKQISTTGASLLSVATDSSYFLYTDGADATGTKGNIGIAAGDGTGATDIVTGAVIDLASTTCAPWGLIDKATAVVSSCALTDGGNATPEIDAFAGSSWTKTVLKTNAGISSPYAAPYLFNFVTDTAGDNVLTVAGASPTGTLSSIGVGGGTATPLTSTFGVPTGGDPNFYLSNSSTFAVFTEANGALGYATYATPSSAPTVTSLIAAPDSGTGGVYGFQVVSRDEKYLIDYTTPFNPASGTALGPASLNLVTIATGASVSLDSNSLATSLGGVNAFTADNNYAIFSSGLVGVGSTGGASVGTLKVAAVATGAITTLVSTPNVWDAESLTGSKVVYNNNYLQTQLPNLNGGATADIYIADATMASPGKLLVAGADAPNYLYVTKDRAHIFYTFSVAVAGEGGIGVPVAGDGLYAVAIP